ncbi:hypothetical protein [Natrinema halophilum]|uniref:Uncharacterized protein n=1 Tax=Natrinema halophilum TaxID=1699371 RepID=A0A7D5H213_9EURY|nr:hypothetical protein [Natrinema halophilum]QLG48731.1 hypothetical protein HYG82_07665 [Natrinema halophilum]
MADSDADRGAESGRGTDTGNRADTGRRADVRSAVDTDEPPYRVALAPLLEKIESFEVDVRAVEAAIAGGLAGGFQAALVIQLYDTDAIRRIGAVVGAPTLDGGWLAMFALGVLFALPFHGYVSRSIDGFVSKVLELSRANEALRTILSVVLRRSALTTTTVVLGNGYGIAIGILFSVFLLPMWLTVVTNVATPVPDVTIAGVAGVIAWTVYGGTLGFVYGLIIEYR